jgi:peptidoglycan-N-acetylglucosamine deacetylase
MNQGAVVSIDVDTLASIYKGTGCRRKGGYSYAEMQIGLENILRFFNTYHCPLTLFMVGNDLNFEQNLRPAGDMLTGGHEIANHTMHHTQGFRFLDPDQKKAEIQAMEDICLKKLGVKPVGFRSPGWNISDDAAPILKELGYIYDSSVFPTSFMPLLKLSHWLSMQSRPSIDRSTMGQSSYMFAPRQPYRAMQNRLDKKGEDGIVEFPITVSPVFHLPFTATFYLLFGWKVYSDILNALIRRNIPIHFQFHLSDFVDYTLAEFSDQMPESRQGVYVPKALRMTYAQKESAFRKIMDKIAQHYIFRRMDRWSSEL